MSTTEKSIENLKQQNLALVEALKTLPIETVSDLITKMPDIEISDELQQKVFFYREEQEQKLLKEAKGDTTLARSALVSALLPYNKALIQSDRTKNKDDDSSSSSEDEDG